MLAACLRPLRLLCRPALVSLPPRSHQAVANSCQLRTPTINSCEPTARRFAAGGSGKGRRQTDIATAAMPKRKADAGDAAADSGAAPLKATRGRPPAKKATPPADESKGTTAKSPAKAAQEAAKSATKPTEAAATSPAKPSKAVPKKAASKEPSAPPGPVYDESMRKPPPSGPHWKVMSWNVAGLRAVLKKDPMVFKKLVEREQPDVLCLQEIKISKQHVADLEMQLQLPGWSCVWNVSTDKAGYSGTATFSRKKPLSTKLGIGHGMDGEGRVVTTEHPDAWIVNAYVPNSGEGLKRLGDRTSLWDPTMSKFVKDLEATGKPVLIVGDLNCAHREIDIHSPKTNLKSAGFTPEERASFEACYLEKGFVDTFRAQFPDVVAYTYYSHRFNARASNRGWRLDYFLASASLAPRAHDSFQIKDWPGSDHIPLGLVLTRP